jgi:tubulin polyglutamylase TTLL9
MIKTIEKEYGKAESAKFEFITTSYVLPQEHALFQEEFKRNPGSVWIMKPVGRAQGKGIFLINKMSQVSQWRKDPRINSNSNRDLSNGNGNNANGEKGENGRNGAGVGRDNDNEPEAYIVQKYIENPYLIGGKKIMKMMVAYPSIGLFAMYK